LAAGEEVEIDAAGGGELEEAVEMLPVPPMKRTRMGTP
jgi:hypothetical protein